jgi:hypothetical protein
MAHETGPAREALLLAAVDRALAGDWPSAHVVAQEHEGDPVADWLHAVVHRMEGDLPNARYWYRRCRREPRDGVSTAQELGEIKAHLAG